MNRDSRLPSGLLPLLISLMAGCIAFSLAEFMRFLLPEWNVVILVAGCMLAAAEAHFSYRWVESRSMYHTDSWKLRLTELLVLFVVLKIGSLVGHGWNGLWAEVRTWPGDPRNVIDAETAFAFIWSLLFWLASTQTARDFQRLQEPPEFQRDERPPLQSLTGLFFFGGAVLLAFSGLARVSVSDLIDLRRASLSGVVLNVLAYFLMGLVLLGQARLIVLSRDWQQQRIEIAPDLTRRWLQYSLLFFGVAAFLAFLLPTGYTLGLLDVARTVLGTAFGVLEVIVRWLVYLVSLPIALLFWLLGRGDAPGPPPETTSLQMPPNLPDAPPSPAWTEVLRAFLSWALVLGIAFYIVYSYLREHPGLLAGLASLAPIRAIQRMWAALRRRLGLLAEAIRRRLPRRASPGRKAGKPSQDRDRAFWRRVGSPRERVIYYYLSALRRASRQGIPRQPFQTPYEYEEALKPNLPDARQEMGLLTHAFVEAKYSPHVVPTEHVSWVRLLWQKVRTAMRALRPDGTASGEAPPPPAPTEVDR